MNFITYINAFGTYKVSEIIEGEGEWETKNFIDEQFLVTSVFINGQKKYIDHSSMYQVAVVNDNNFDGSNVSLNFYNDPDYFRFGVVDLSAGSVDSSVQLSQISKDIEQTLLKPEFPVYLYFDSFSAFASASSNLKKGYLIKFDVSGEFPSKSILTRVMYHGFMDHSVSPYYEVQQKTFASSNPQFNFGDFVLNLSGLLSTEKTNFSFYFYFSPIDNTFSFVPETNNLFPRYYADDQKINIFEVRFNFDGAIIPLFCAYKSTPKMYY